MFKKRSVATITASLSKMVSELHSHADEHVTSAVTKTETAERLFAEVDSHHDEAAQARKVAERIGTLING
jgi:hypothetical protein